MRTPALLLLLSSGVVFRQDTLPQVMGRITGGDHHRPLPGSSVVVRRLAPPDSARYFAVNQNGEYRVDGLVPGTYEVTRRSIGYRARRDTLTIAHNVTFVRDAELVVETLRFGENPPDSARVAAMRARRAEWGCLADPTVVAGGRRSWAETLAEAPLLQEQLSLHGDTVYFHRLIVPVLDRSVCRRAAAAFDRIRGASSLMTLVYRAGPYYLVSQPSEHLVILDRAWRVVYYFVWE